MKDKTALSAPVIPAQPPTIPPPISAPASDPATQQNYVPAMAQEATDFKFGEANDLTPCPSRKEIAIEFQVNHTLPQRRLYAYLWINPSDATDYFVRAEIRFYRNESLVGALPLHAGVSKTGGSSILKESVASVCNADVGNVVNDSIGLTVANPVGTQPASVVLQPLRIWADVDRVRLAIIQIGNVTDARAWLACVSSKQ